MDASGQNYKDTFRYTDVEYTPDGHTDVYRWDDFLGIAGGHVYSAMDTIDMVSTGGQYEGDEPEHAYACEVVGCCGLSDGVALFRPVSHDGADLIQIAFLRNDVDDATGAYTERFEAGSFDLPAADLPRSESRVDLLEYFSGRSFKHTPGVNRGLDPREAVDSIEDAIGCDLGLFDGFWLGVPGEAVVVGEGLGVGEVGPHLLWHERGGPEATDGLRAYCDPIGVGWNYGPIYYFPHESVEQIVGQLCEDGDDFPILFDGENVIEAFDGSPVHMSAPVEVDGERVWTCGYDFCWGETVAPDFSRARGHFPDATVAAWAAARSVNESDGYLGIKERM